VPASSYFYDNTTHSCLWPGCKMRVSQMGKSGGLAGADLAGVAVVWACTAAISGGHMQSVLSSIL
jgi:hypothetical protein